jgi:tetratricopeptide (TPR) repeat protein
MKLFSRLVFATTCILIGLTLLPAIAATSSDQSTIIERYRLSLEIDPDNPTLHYFLGIALIREGQTKEGLKELRIAYPAYTDSIEMQYNMGLAFSKLGDPDSAMLYLEQAEALGALNSPDVFPLINAFYNVGLTYLENDNLSEAEHIFNKVLHLDPSRVEVYRLLGDIAARSKRTEDAQKYIAKYLEHYPDDQSAREYLYALYFNRALKQLGKDDTVNARQSFLKAYELAPDSPLVLYYLGSIDYNAGNLDSAIDKLRRAFPNAPEELGDSTRAMLYNCALQLTQSKQWDKALVAMEPLVEGKSPRTKDLLLTGNIYLQQQNYTAARKFYLQVLARDPANSKAIINLTNAENGAVDNLFNKGRKQFQKGEYSNALETFNAVLDIRPDEHRSLSYKKKALSRMASDATGAFSKAKRALQRKDYLNAVTHANRGLEMQPENLEGKNLRREALKELEKETRQLIENGNALLARNDYIGAEAQFNKVIKLDPDNSQALSGLNSIDQKKRQNALLSVKKGNQALDEGKLKEAKTAFNAALILSPELQEAKDGLARLESLIGSMISQEVQWGRRAKSAGRLDQAKKHFRNALELKDSPEIRRELAAIDQARSSKIDSLLAAARKSRTAKDYPKARTLYRRILDFNPQHAARTELEALEAEVSASIATALNEARKHMLNNKYQAALASYRQALDLDPANKAALAGLEKGRSKLKSTINTLVDSGKKALDKGDFKTAESNFNKVLALDPYNTEARAALQRLDKIRLAGAKSGDENKLYLRGIELYTKGKYAEAVSAWEQVLMLSPSHAKAKMNIEKAQRKLKKIKEFQGG